MQAVRPKSYSYFWYINISSNHLFSSLSVCLSVCLCVCLSLWQGLTHQLSVNTIHCLYLTKSCVKASSWSSCCLGVAVFLLSEANNSSRVCLRGAGLIKVTLSIICGNSLSRSGAQDLLFYCSWFAFLVVLITLPYNSCLFSVFAWVMFLSRGLTFHLFPIESQI